MIVPTFGTVCATRHTASRRRADGAGTERRSGGQTGASSRERFGRPVGGNAHLKVLVTGGAGFIGTRLVTALVSNGHEIVVLDNLRRSTRARMTAYEHTGAVRCIEGDVRDLSLLREAARGVQRIYHLAAQSNVLGAVSDIEYSFSTNVVGTFNVLMAARDADVERVIFTSSRETYGEVEHLPVAEDRPLVPKNAYGASKVAGEAYCRAFANAYGLDISVLRLANVYGPGDRDRVIPIWLDRARLGQDLVLYGGDQVLDFVPTPLVIEALRRAGDTSLACAPVNVGSGTGTSLTALAERVRTLPGVDIGLQILPARSVEVTRFVADVTRMRELLGLEPPSDPLEALEAMWGATRSGPDGSGAAGDVVGLGASEQSTLED
jgi:nucleoside-diphosphate-sugar epimerase